MDFLFYMIGFGLSLVWCL